MALVGYTNPKMLVGTVHWWPGPVSVDGLLDDYRRVQLQSQDLKFKFFLKKNVVGSLLSKNHMESVVTILDPWSNAIPCLLVFNSCRGLDMVRTRTPQKGQMMSNNVGAPSYASIKATILTINDRGEPTIHYK